MTLENPELDLGFSLFLSRIAHLGALLERLNTP